MKPELLIVIIGISGVFLEFSDAVDAVGIDGRSSSQQVKRAFKHLVRVMPGASCLSSSCARGNPGHETFTRQTNTLTFPQNLTQSLLKFLSHSSTNQNQTKTKEEIRLLFEQLMWGGWVRVSFNGRIEFLEKSVGIDEHRQDSRKGEGKVSCVRR